MRAWLQIHEHYAVVLCGWMQYGDMLVTDVMTAQPQPGYRCRHRPTCRARQGVTLLTLRHDGRKVYHDHSHRH